MWYHSEKNAPVIALFPSPVEDGALATPAAHRGDLDELKRLFERGEARNPSWCLNIAAETGKLDCVEYAIAKGGRTYSMAIITAAKSQQWHIVDFLAERYTLDLEGLKITSMPTSTSASVRPHVARQFLVC